MSPAGMWLEIRRGQTNFPLRPVSGDRFLIGAGSHCHLQLGGENVPMLHSLLMIEGKTAHLEAVVATPPLLINGEPRRMVELKDEDAVAIGEFEFVFHQLIALESAAQVSVGEPITAEATNDVEDLSRLSTAELVELIEAEARQITEYNQSREYGAAALLDAAHRASAEEPHPASVPMVAFRADLMSDSVPDRLPAQLQWQSQCLAEREAECLRQAAQLQAAQQQLAAQMAEFATQVARWQDTERQPTRRASA